MQILEFFKSLVMPSKMVKYKFMSILISICIFVLASYLLAVPARPFITKNMDKLVEENNYLYLQSIENIPVNEEMNKVFIELQSKECAVDETGNLVCNNMGTEIVDGKEVPITLYETSLEYVREDGMKIHFTFVIDLFNEKNEPQYYPERKFVYSDEKFPDIDNTEYYLIVFWKDSLYYQAHPTNIKSANVTHGEIILTELSQKAFFINLMDTGSFSFENFKNDTFYAKAYLLERIMTGHIPNYVGQYSLSTFIFTVIFTLILTMLFWLFFRKSGRLKKFKEYYNIAAISSVVPTILVFILMWIEMNMLSYYIFIFSVFYLFVLYKINNSSKIA